MDPFAFAIGFVAGFAWGVVIGFGLEALVLPTVVGWFGRGR